MPQTQTLHRFGFNPDAPTIKNTSPTPVLDSTQIKILWTSWCDLIYITTDASSTRSVTYSGTSLNAIQQQEFTSSTSTINQSIGKPGCDLSLFGSAMHDGVRGYICNGKFSIFSTIAEELDLEDESSDISIWPTPSQVTSVSILSDASLLLSLRDQDQEEENAGNITTAKDLQALKLSFTTLTFHASIAPFLPTQLVTNATTATALSPSGWVYTRTTDPRYPSCLGRPHTGTLDFEPVPYLSETHVVKIASGGYTSAAISEEGELFMWGQSCPGTEGELGVLRGLDYESERGDRETFICGETEQDEYVKCLSICIDGHVARAYDVAIGFGHVLVAAKNDVGAHVVFSGGCGGEGQLGHGRPVDFLAEFEELTVLRGNRVVQLAASGWSSFVVTEYTDAS